MSSGPVDIIKEYLAEIGFKVDEKSVQAVNASFSKMERVLNGFMKGLADNKGFKAFSKGLEILAKEAEEIAVKVGASFAGPIAAITVGFVAITTAVTAASAVFATKMAQMDLETKKFAISLFTTTQNARSLKSVMDAMGVQSLDDLKYVNLIPEQREQFLKLRQLASGLSLNGGQQEGMENIRKVGYEMQKFQVIFSYFWQKVAGTLGKLLEGPLKKLDVWLSKNSDRFAKSIDRFALAMAQVLEYSILFTEQLTKLFLPLSGLIGLMPVLHKFGWAMKLLADTVLFIMRQINSDGARNNGLPKKNGSANPLNLGLATGLMPGPYLVEKLLPKAGEGIGNLFPHGKTGTGGHSLNRGVGKEQITPYIFESLKQLDKKFQDLFIVTSGKEGRSGRSYHPGGLAFDAVPSNGSIKSWANLVKGMLETANVARVNLEVKGANYDPIMKELKRQHVDTSRVSHQFTKDYSGEHVHASLKKPIQITINVNGAKDPTRTAMATREALQNVSLSSTFA